MPWLSEISDVRARTVKSLNSMMLVSINTLSNIFADYNLYDLCTAITKKEFGKDDNNGKDSMIWKNRQKDWYNAERRFIFASATEKAKDKWIKHIERVKTNKSLLRNKSTLETDRETIVPF